MKRSIQNEKDAILIWIIRWLKQLSPSKDKYSSVSIQAKFGELDARRLYELWEGKVFPNSNKKAFALFSKLFPDLVRKIDPSFHIPHNKVVNRDQLDLFNDAA